MDRMWLLVEWVDEKNVFPSYGIVNVTSLVNDSSDIHTGKMIFIQTRYGNSARRAQILRMSVDKRQIQEYKLFMQRQDQQVKNVISMCMRTIKEIKAEPVIQEYNAVGSKQQSIAGPSGSRLHGLPQIVAETDSDDSDGDSDSETSQESAEFAAALISKSVAKLVTPNKRVDHYQSNNQRMRQKRLPVASTPLPIKETAKVSKDQETQTDAAAHPAVVKLEEMESTLRNLFAQYLVLERSIQTDQNEARELLHVDMSETEHNCSVGSDREQADESLNGRNSEETGERQANNSDAEMKANGHATNAKTLHVRRVSAQTTNNAETIYNDTPIINNRGNDMISIGNGCVTVPARLIREMNWDNYSTATRQLLQAVFPRRILATHSLSGKQSPAFANKPPKKQLDPRMIDDIVNTVSQRCGVPRRLVRSSITTKCTDEAKLFRNRQCGRRSRQANSTIENLGNVSVPLSPLSSHESSNGIE